MLTKLIIRNFQKHERLSIKLDPYVTTIVGPSDAGKSSILRALGWVLLNRPRGTAFIRNGSNRAQVILRTADHKIKRTRGQKNTYELDGSTFTAFGNDVPAEISRILNVSELNFQGQHDSVFWFSKSAGEVSKQLNAIVDLSVIDSTLANLGSALRKARMEESVIERRLEEAREERKRLKPARQADESLKVVEEAQSLWSSEALRASQLNDLIEEGSQAEKKAQSLPEGLRKGLKRLERKGRKLLDLQNKLHDLEGLTKNADDVVKNLKCQRDMRATYHDKLIESFGEECPLCRQQIRS